MLCQSTGGSTAEMLTQTTGGIQNYKLGQPLSSAGMQEECQKVFHQVMSSFRGFWLRNQTEQLSSAYTTLFGETSSPAGVLGSTWNPKTSAEPQHSTWEA